MLKSFHISTFSRYWRLRSCSNCRLRSRTDNSCRTARNFHPMGEKLTWFGKRYQKPCAHGAYVDTKWQNCMKISPISPIQEVCQEKARCKTAYSKADYNGIAGASLTDSGLFLSFFFGSVTLSLIVALFSPAAHGFARSFRSMRFCHSDSE